MGEVHLRGREECVEDIVSNPWPITHKANISQSIMTISSRGGETRISRESRYWTRSCDGCYPIPRSGRISHTMPLLIASELYQFRSSFRVLDKWHQRPLSPALTLIRDTLTFFHGQAAALTGERYVMSQFL